MENGFLRKNPRQTSNKNFPEHYQHIVITLPLSSTHFRLHRTQSYRETAKTISSSRRSLPFPTSRCIKLMSRSAPSTRRRFLRYHSPSLISRWPRVVPELRRHRGDLTAFADGCHRAAAQLFAVLFLKIRMTRN